MQPPKLSTYYDSMSSTEETQITSTTQHREAQQHELWHPYYHTNRRPHHPHKGCFESLTHEAIKSPPQRATQTQHSSANCNNQSTRIYLA